MQTAGVQDQPAVAMSPDGTFVVTWASTPNYYGLSNTNSYNTAIFAREYDDGDVPLGNEFQVTPSSTVGSSLPSVAIDANDNFVIVWEGDFQSGATWGVYGDYFTATSAGAAVLPTSWTSTGVKLLNQQPNSRGSFTAELELRSVQYRSAGRHDPLQRHDAGRIRGHLGRLRERKLLDFRPAVRAQRHGQQHGRLNTASTLMVNPPQSTTGRVGPFMPAVSVDPEGDIGIVWTTYGQDNANNDFRRLVRHLHDDLLFQHFGQRPGRDQLRRVPRERHGPWETSGGPAIGFNDFEDDALVAWVGPAPAAITSTAGNAAATSIYDRDMIRPTRRPACWCPTRRRFPPPMRRSPWGVPAPRPR